MTQTGLKFDQPSFWVNGAEVAPDPSGALFWPAESTLVVSDLHFEKGSSFAARGVFLPPYDTRATLALVAKLCARYQPRRVISLGDAFHDPMAERRMHRDDVSRLEELTRAHEWVWITGNHDPHPPARFRGRVCETLRLGALTFRHEPENTAKAGEVAGHLHPCARVKGAGRSVRRKCFVTDGRRLINPPYRQVLLDIGVQRVEESALRLPTGIDRQV